MTLDEMRGAMAAAATGGANGHAEKADKIDPKSVMPKNVIKRGSRKKGYGNAARSEEILKVVHRICNVVSPVHQRSFRTLGEVLWGKNGSGELEVLQFRFVRAPFVEFLLVLSVQPRIFQNG